jgi:signal peptidase
MFVQAPPERIISKNARRNRRINDLFKVFGYTLSAVLITFSVLSASGFVKARIVLTGSMEPSISSGDIVILAPTPRAEPKIDDVVAYTGRRFSGEAVGTFTHRIIGGDAQSGFLVKGDANPSPDVQKPTKNDISGVVFFVIPFIGKFLTPKMLMILVPVGLGLWLILDTLKSDS